MAAAAKIDSFSEISKILSPQISLIKFNLFLFSYKLVKFSFTALLQNDSQKSGSRSQRNQIVFSPIKINLNQFIEEVILILKSMADHKKITIEHIKNNDIFVLADWNMLHTILRNLISNAIKFTPKEGKIKIQSVLKAQTAFISVEDNGIGMSGQKARDIFKIGVKISQAGTSGEKGTGLGLILCKDFVEKNGGKIDVFSELGKGTSFVFTLPAFED